MFSKVLAAVVLSAGIGLCASAQAVYPHGGKKSEEKDCFVDQDRNKICDKSTRAGARCKFDCSSEPRKEDKKKDKDKDKKKKKKKKSENSPCNGCSGGDCTQCLAALLAFRSNMA